jgi:RNA polymerase sigma-70 factor (ECF subfamily)
MNTQDRFDERPLICAAQAGDQPAFNELMISYQSLAFNVAYRILGDDEAAADVTQDAFLSAYRAIRSFRGGSFKAWLLRIVTNACYDSLRRKQRRPSSSLDAWLVGSSRHHAFTDRSEDPESYVMRRDLEQALQRGLRMLSVDQRVAVVLSDIHGLSYPEIAQVEGVPLGTVKSRVSRGRARLRDYLLAQDDLLPRRYHRMERVLAMS